MSCPNFVANVLVVVVHTLGDFDVDNNFDSASHMCRRPRRIGIQIPNPSHGLHAGIVPILGGGAVVTRRRAGSQLSAW